MKGNRFTTCLVTCTEVVHPRGVQGRHPGCLDRSAGIPARFRSDMFDPRAFQLGNYLILCIYIYGYTCRNSTFRIHKIRGGIKCQTWKYVNELLFFQGAGLFWAPFVNFSSFILLQANSCTCFSSLGLECIYQGKLSNLFLLGSVVYMAFVPKTMWTVTTSACLSNSISFVYIWDDT